MNIEQIIESLLSNDKELLELIPAAIQVLKEDVLVEAKFYKGDLLMTVLSTDKDFWQENPDYKKEVLAILKDQSEKIKNEDVSFEMKVDWYAKIEGFKKI